MQTVCKARHTKVGTTLFNFIPQVKIITKVSLNSTIMMMLTRKTTIFSILKRFLMSRNYVNINEQEYNWACQYFSLTLTLVSLKDLVRINQLSVTQKHTVSHHNCRSILSKISNEYSLHINNTGLLSQKSSESGKYETPQSCDSSLFVLHDCMPWR